MTLVKGCGNLKKESLEILKNFKKSKTSGVTPKNQSRLK